MARGQNQSDAVDGAAYVYFNLKNCTIPLRNGMEVSKRFCLQNLLPCFILYTKPCGKVVICNRDTTPLP